MTKCCYVPYFKLATHKVPLLTDMLQVDLVT